jgi:hypothetical protein
MNERSITPEQISAAKTHSRVHLRQRMQTEALPHGRSEDAMTLCTLNATIALQTAYPKVVRIFHVQAHLVFVQACNGRVYVVDADGNTCTCPTWRKHRTCKHITTVREHFYQ